MKGAGLLGKRDMRRYAVEKRNFTVDRCMSCLRVIVSVGAPSEEYKLAELFVRQSIRG